MTLPRQSKQIFMHSASVAAWSECYSWFHWTRFLSSNYNTCNAVHLGACCHIVPAVTPVSRTRHAEAICSCTSCRTCATRPSLNWVVQDAQLRIALIVSQNLRDRMWLYAGIVEATFATTTNPWIVSSHIFYIHMLDSFSVFLHL